MNAPAAIDRPPITNRGVYPPSDIDGSALIHAFDYYRATVGASVEHVLQTLEAHYAEMGIEAARIDGAPVRHYGANRQLVDRTGHVLVTVLSGGQNGRPNVYASGSRAPAVAECIRRHWSHRPSRVDVKCDLGAPGLFEELRSHAFTFADRLGLHPPKEQRNNHPDQGDTIYLGSRQSQVFLRVYQPGLKRAQEEGRTGEAITIEERQAVRIEMEFKPQKPRAKHFAATLSPAQMWGVGGWAASYASEVFAMDVQPISISERRESNRNRALRFMASQYRAHLADLLRECGNDPADFGSALIELADIAAPIDKCITSGQVAAAG